PVGHAGVIDFAGVGGVTLFFNDLNLKEGDYLVIRNLGNNRIAGVHPSWGNAFSKERNIAMEVDGKLMSIRHYWPGKNW
ncbi:hypothetical protein, partial [Cephaloticoccus primus]|uniref:hypothetical protein n=1 Tax=Cephaloticoccus primus TaxID=1548207 RepID=UPI001E4234DB